MWDAEVLKRSVLVVFVLFSVVMLFILLVKELVEKARKNKAVASEAIENFVY